MQPQGARAKMDMPNVAMLSFSDAKKTELEFRQE
jgi:hypothetical protein